MLHVSAPLLFYLITFVFYYCALTLREVREIAPRIVRDAAKGSIRGCARRLIITAI